MPQNTTQGGLSLDEALAQLREHYTRKVEHDMSMSCWQDSPSYHRSRGALEALAALEWHTQAGAR